MAKVMNVIFGVGIAIVIYLLIILGIKAFNPEPEYTDFCPERDFSEPFISPAPCPAGMTEQKCLDFQAQQRAEIEQESQEKSEELSECKNAYNDARKSYNEYVFLTASIVGTITMIASGILLFKTNLINISAGIAIAGLAAISYGFIRGWDSTGDKLKFFIALIVSIIVIILGILINKKLREQHKKTRKR